MFAFPKNLPRAVQRRKKTDEIAVLMCADNVNNHEEEKTSLKDLFTTVKRLLTNKAYVCNTMAAIFYVFGYIPYGFFMSKYLQIQYLLTPSYANTMTGSIAFAASAVGLLSAGIVITLFKPRARYLAGWNIVTSLISALGLMTYAFLGCPANNNALIIEK